MPGATSAPAAAGGEADALFQQGKARLAAQDYAAACPLLAQSYALDPATGSLLALALCHEHQGKLASAFREYTDAAARSKDEQRSDRERAARAQAAAIEPKLSSLTISTNAAPNGLEVHLDGAPLDAAQLGKALPLDGGDHVIDVSAPHKQPWHTQLTLAKSQDVQKIQLAALQDEPVAAPLPAPARVASSAPRPAPRATSSGPSASAWVGLATIGAGIIGVGIGSYFAVRASSEHDHADSCQSEVCTYRQTRNSGDAAALAFVIGGSLVATGAVIYLISKPSSSSESASAATMRPLTAAAWVAPHAAGGAMRGSF